MIKLYDTIVNGSIAQCLFYTALAIIVIGLAVGIAVRVAKEIISD
jgi:hypothetical protein